MDPGKVSAVRDWTTPTNLKEVRAFVGFANFYRRFIKDFASIAHTLHDLTRKDTPWHWAHEQQHAFDTLKGVFCQEPILKVYDPQLPTRVKVNASGFATGVSRSGLIISSYLSLSFPSSFTHIPLPHLSVLPTS